jgi:hypothetical protein
MRLAFMALVNREASACTTAGGVHSVHQAESSVLLVFSCNELVKGSVAALGCH